MVWRCENAFPRLRVAACIRGLVDHSNVVDCVINTLGLDPSIYIVILRVHSIKYVLLMNYSFGQKMRECGRCGLFDHGPIDQEIMDLCGFDRFWRLSLHVLCLSRGGGAS